MDHTMSIRACPHSGNRYQRSNQAPHTPHPTQNITHTKTHKISSRAICAQNKTHCHLTSSFLTLLSGSRRSPSGGRVVRLPYCARTQNFLHVAASFPPPLTNTAAPRTSTGWRTSNSTHVLHTSKLPRSYSLPAHSQVHHTRRCIFCNRHELHTMCARTRILHAAPRLYVIPTASMSTFHSRQVARQASNKMASVRSHLPACWVFSGEGTRRKC